MGECRRTRRVLVVDDYRDAADAMAELLGAEGYEVEVAYTGADAAAAATRCRPDAVLLEVSLPWPDGHSAAELLRQTPGIGDAPVVALTSQAGETERLRGAGFAACFLKPIDPAGLLGYLGALLAGEDAGLAVAGGSACTCCSG